MDNDKQLGLGRVRQAGSGPAHLATRHIGTEPQRLQSSPWESTQDRLIHDSFVAVARAWRFILTVCWLHIPNGGRVQGGKKALSGPVLHTLGRSRPGGASGLL